MSSIIIRWLIPVYKFHAVGLSVDWINNKIYFVESHYSTANDYIGVLDFANNHFMKLITTSVGNIEDVVVDPTMR